MSNSSTGIVTFPSSLPPKREDRYKGAKNESEKKRKYHLHQPQMDWSWRTLLDNKGEKPTWVSPHSLVSPLNLLPRRPFIWKCECMHGMLEIFMSNGWNLCNVSKSSLSPDVTAFHTHSRHWSLHLICFLVRGWNAFNELQWFYV